MPVTCGSIGDIIAVSLLVKDLVTALNQSRGSQAEYNQLVDELNLLKDVLDRIVHLCNTAGTTVAVRTFEVSALHDATLKIAQNCRKCIEAFNVGLQKYDKTLGSSGARSKREGLRSAVAQLRWRFGEKEDLVRFRADIARQTASLNLALGATTWSVGKDNQDILVKYGDATGNQLQAQHGVLSKLSDTTAETNKLASNTNSLSGQIVGELATHSQTQHNALSKLSDTAIKTNVLVSQTRALSSQIVDGLAKIGDLCAQAKSTMSKILFINMATYKMVVALKLSLPSYLERSLFNEPFVLEDAIGRISPVHLQFITSWEAFDAVLDARFRGLQGHDKVRGGHWILLDNATGREINRRSNWEGAFLPGQRVNMSLLFQRETTVETFDSSVQTETNNQAACPRCQADVPDSRDAEVQCGTCNLCFRRIVEIEEVDPKPTPAAPKPWLDKPTFGMASFRPTFGPQPATPKRRRETDDFDISGFKRIHITSRESRVKRHVFRSAPYKPPGPYSSEPQITSIGQPFHKPGPAGAAHLGSGASGIHSRSASGISTWQPTVGGLRNKRVTKDDKIIELNTSGHNSSTKAVVRSAYIHDDCGRPNDIEVSGNTSATNAAVADVMATHHWTARTASAAMQNDDFDLMSQRQIRDFYDFGADLMNDQNWIDQDVFPIEIIDGSIAVSDTGDGHIGDSFPEGPFWWDGNPVKDGD